MYIESIANLIMDTITKAELNLEKIFFKYSDKKQGYLEENISQICFESSKKKLVNLCKTRWVARHDALRVFIELYQAILETIFDIYEDKIWNLESITKSNGILQYYD